MTTETVPPAGLTDEDLLRLEQLALEEVKLAAEAEAIAERRETIKAILRDRLPQGAHRLGATTVQVKAGARRLNTRRLQQAYPVTEHPELYSANLDTAKVKHALAPAVLDGFYDAGTPTVVVK